MNENGKQSHRITREEIRHVAGLARLTVAEEDLPLFAEQIGNILEYVDKLNQVTTESVSPTAQAVLLENVFREDRPEKRSDNTSSLANAPAENEGMFQVPRIID